MRTVATFNFNNAIMASLWASKYGVERRCAIFSKLMKYVFREFTEGAGELRSAHKLSSDISIGFCFDQCLQKFSF